VNVLWVPRTESQRVAEKAFRASDILFILGASGSGKTHTAISLALREVLPRRTAKLVLMRPSIECDGENLGFLPGDLDEKLEPWLGAFKDILASLRTDGNAKLNAAEVMRDKVEVWSLGHIRGRNLDDRVLVVTEAQNLSENQITAIITRLGRGSKIVLEGDLDQTDLRLRDDYVPLGDAADLYWGLTATDETSGRVHRVGVVEFGADDVVRHPLVKAIVKRTWDEDR
jgi:phosphate starvation-inducible PhoH-like protein